MTETARPEVTPNAPVPGEAFGGFQILRLLGRGGMGAVYEAESMEDGRRVAIKVLAADLAGPDDRRRFLREGQLAASLNHPNTVYIYGTDEVNGMQTITMELVAGGTLDDKVKERGPLPMAGSIEVTLQMIDGLAAAHALGILHRDVKPSNCFVGVDGSIKVGDFGLSKSVAGGEESKVTRTGMFLGTPAYSAPEQLLGEPLDVRSDIYSVGATLYYLLTGRLPFEAASSLNMVAAVLQGSPVSPKRHRPEIPDRLAVIVTKCLERKPDDRYPAYDELRKDLDALRERDVMPAPVLSRMGAFAIDFGIMLLVMGTVQVIPLIGLILNETSIRSNAFDAVMLWVVKGIPESFWGASAGKVLLGLRVERRTGERLGLAKGAIRILVIGIALAVGDVVSLAVAESSRELPGFGLTVAGMLALMVSMRRTNGYAALHDLLAGSRVVRSMNRNNLVQPMRKPTVRPVLAAEDAGARIGPYVLLHPGVAEGSDGTVDLAFDPVLRRSLWVHRRPQGAPLLSIVRRDLARPGRLRWVASRRRDGDSWDAYEAPDGATLVTTVNPVSWKTTTGWLRDIADELSAAQKSGDRLDVSLERIWVSGARALVLDFPVGATVAGPDRDSLSAGECLQRIARRALMLDGPRWPVLPRSVRAVLDELPEIADPAAIVSRIDNVAELPQEVSRRNRAIAMALTVAGPIALAIALWLVVSYDDRAHPEQERLEPFLEFLDDTLPTLPDSSLIESIEIKGIGGIKDIEGFERARRAAAVYLLSRYGSFLAESARSTGMRVDDVAWSRVDAVLSRHRNYTPSDSSEAARTVEQEWRGQVPGQRVIPVVIVAVIAGALALIVTGLLSLVVALAFGVGLTSRMAGIDVVTRDGGGAGRMRLFLRAILIWLPVVGAAALAPDVLRIVRSSSEGNLQTLLLVGGGMMVLGCVAAAFALVTPQRGIADRLAGTYLVPR